MNLKDAESAVVSLNNVGDVTYPVRSGFLPDRIVHLHPTRMCNLACLHCYSNSAPQQKASLDIALITSILPVLRAEGYTTISLSGGEPLVYPRLAELVERARGEGFRATMITNGLLATERMDGVLSMLDAIAVSFDGLAATHNRVRGRDDAFDRAGAAVKRMADKGWPVAAAISLTREAIPELPELADHLVTLGARALQVRPVARAGRARNMPAHSFFTDSDQARLYLVVLALRQELPQNVRVHCDLAPMQGLWQQRDAYSALLATCARAPHEWPLAELINPLVITDTGILKPIAFDFNPAFDIASIRQFSSDQLTHYKRDRLVHCQSLIGEALARLEHGQGLIDWFDYCTRLSEQWKESDLLHNVSCPPAESRAPLPIQRQPA